MYKTCRKPSKLPQDVIKFDWDFNFFILKTWQFSKSHFSPNFTCLLSFLLLLSAFSVQGRLTFEFMRELSNRLAERSKLFSFFWEIWVKIKEKACKWFKGSGNYVKKAIIFKKACNTFKGSLTSLKNLKLI